MLFISVCSSDANQVPKVLHVVEEIKRLRYKAGTSLESAGPSDALAYLAYRTQGDPDLHQYVLYDTKTGVTPQKGPRIINLDDNDGKGKKKEYTPPKSLTVHLSKIDMPELRPRGTPLDTQHMTRHDRDSGKKKEKDQSKHVREKERTKERDKDKDRDKDGRLKSMSRHSTSPPHPTVLHKQRSQYFHPTSPTQTPPGSLSQFPAPSYHGPPLPSRSQHSAGMPRRQSMYGSLNADHYYYDYYENNPNVTSPTNNSPSGLLGRLLGR